MFADTSWLVGFVMERDGRHFDALGLFMAHQRRPRFTSSLVLGECWTLLNSRFSADATGGMDRILALRRTMAVVPASEAAHDRAMAEARKLQVSYVDAVSFELMRALGINEALTFDRDFHRAGFTRLAGPS